MFKFIVFCIIFISPFASFAQSITMQCGVARSSLDVWFPGFDKTISNEVILAGIEYPVSFLPEKYFKLSSNLGYISKGTEGMVHSTDEYGLPLPPYLLKYRYYYITANTCLEGRIPICSYFEPFASVGPRIDFLLSARANSDNIDNSNSVNYGAIIGGGIRFHIGLFQVGARSDYYLNFNNIYKSGTLTINDRTYTITGFVGVNI